MTWKERLDEWLVSEQVKQAVKKNEDAHKALEKTIDGLKGVDALLKGEKGNANA